MLSRRVCKECHNKLAQFYYFKQELVSKQEKLYQLLEAAKVNEGVEELLHEDSAYDDVKPAKLEPEVDIKTEYEAITFEPYDCDVQSGELSR